MTDKEMESLVQMRIAIAMRQAKERNVQWDHYIRLLTNQWGGKMEIAANKIHSSVRQLVATVLFDDPEFFARAMKQKYINRASGVTAYMNYLWDKMELAEQTELVITDAVVYPFGAWSLGVGRSLMSERQLADLEAQEKAAAAEQEAWLIGDFDTPVADDDRHATHIPSHENFLTDERVKQSPFQESIFEAANAHIDTHGELLDVVGTTLSPDTEGDEPDIPHAYRVSPRDIFFDGQHMLPEQSRYLLIKNRFNFDEWMENKAYRHPDGVQPTDTTDESKVVFEGDSEVDKSILERGVGVIDVWRHYDKVTGKMSEHLEAVEEPVKKFQDMPYRYVSGYPLELVRFQVVPEQMTGPGILTYLDHPQQLDIDTVHRMAVHVRNSSVKWGVITDRLKNNQNAEQVKDDLQNPDMDAVIELQQENAIQQFPPAQLDPSLFQIRGIIDDTVQQAVGLSDAQRGDITGATATEVRTASGASQTVLSANAKKIRRSISKMMGKVLAIQREWGPEYMVLPVWGKENEWTEFKRDDLVGDWQIRVELPLPGDRQLDLNNALNALQQMRSSPNVKGEGMKRLESLVLKRLDLEPDLFMSEQTADSEKAVQLEHKEMLRGELPEPLPGEDATYHVEQHDELMSFLERQLIQGTNQLQQFAQQGQQAAQVNPQAGKQLQLQAGIVQQQVQQIQQQMQIVQQHLEATQALMPNVPFGRRKNALVFPDGNPGTPESITSNEIGGT